MADAKRYGCPLWVSIGLFAILPSRARPLHHRFEIAAGSSAAGRRSAEPVFRAEPRTRTGLTKRSVSSSTSKRLPHRPRLRVASASSPIDPRSAARSARAKISQDTAARAAKFGWFNRIRPFAALAIARPSHGPAPPKRPASAAESERPACDRLPFGCASACSVHRPGKVSAAENRFAIRSFSRVTFAKTLQRSTLSSYDNRSCIGARVRVGRASKPTSCDPSTLGSDE